MVIGMPTMSELDQALATLDPTLEGFYAFALVDEVPEGLRPFAVIPDRDEWTVVLDVDQAREKGLPTDEVYAKVSLGLTSALAAVGVTASIAQVLSSRSITANFIASNRTNHLFVQKDRAQEALSLLSELGRSARGWLPQV
ncbi:ACT domain-containing protein [Schaalia sp. 19OD2882]|nr:ACT domain-containing protein [Schaalia sp. 19OD2882]